MTIAEQLPLFRLPTPETQDRRRHVQLGNRIVPYQLRQAPRRRLTMTIDERGLRVGAPRSITLGEIEAFVREHAEWVLGKLDEFAAGAHRRRLHIRDGAIVPVLGREVAIRLGRGPNRCFWSDDGSLLLQARADADLQALARRGLQRRALEHFGERADHYAPLIDVNVPRLMLSSAHTRWGSCAPSGIRINWRLVHLPAVYADYVIAHELAHLRVLDHGQRFWATVARMFPDWRAVRAELRQRAADIPAL